MPADGPSDADTWRAYLATALPGWTGREPATEDAIAAAEQRLGVRLPPSYRSFLLVSNGGENLDGPDDDSSPLFSLLPVEEIVRFQDDMSELIDAWDHLDEDQPELRSAMRASILIADGGDGAYWYLDPSETEDWEWRAWRWGAGDGLEPEPAPSFAAAVAAAVADELDEDDDEDDELD